MGRSIMLLTFAVALLMSRQISPCRGWAVTNRRPSAASGTRHFRLDGSLFEEPDNQFGTIAYWDESYRKSLIENRDDEGDDDDGSRANENSTAETFSWYCGWESELEPFFSEIVPPGDDPCVLVPGVGNDACVRDMFDSGYRRLSAFDYAPEGVECARRMFGPRRLRMIDDLRVADARSLPYDEASFDAVLDKGTLDSIYLSGGKDKDLARKHLGMAVSELARVVRAGGIVFSVTAACVDAVQESFDECNESWKQIRDGSLYITEDGYTSNNVDATMLVWERIE